MVNDQEEVQMNVAVPSDLHAKMKALAATQKRPMRDLVAAAIVRFLEPPNARRKRASLLEELITSPVGRDWPVDTSNEELATLRKILNLLRRTPPGDPLRDILEVAFRLEEERERRRSS